MKGRSLRQLFAALVCVAALPTLAHAQSAIGGTVKDATGAVLPGVTVEAASPVLIEKTKTVSHYWEAITYAALGEKDKAFVELEKAYQAHDWFLQRLKVDPVGLVGDARHV